MASTHVSEALIPWDPDSNKAVAKTEENGPDGGRWALMRSGLWSPSPGRTLDRAYTSLGKVLETQANRAAYSFGLGPHIVAQKIKSYFGNGEERVLQLESLCTSIPPKLEKRCHKLIRYAVPTESADTQCRAFKDIMEIVTLFPGLRALFLHEKYIEGNTKMEAISALWSRADGAPDDKWTFWQMVAATCLADTTLSTILEDSAISLLTTCDAGGLGVIERLLVEYDCSASTFSRALCIRYLGGILDLPGFWSETGSVHSDVANKLCGLMTQVLKDIGVDIPVLGPANESEPPFDYDGVDFLATTILTGLSNWLQKLDHVNWPIQHWFDSFREFLQLVRRPRAEEFLPNSCTFAATIFEDILASSYQKAELNVMVDGEHKTSTNRDTPDNHLTELSCENDSSSLHSDHSLDESEDPDSLQEDDSDVQSQNSGLNSVEEDISSNSDDKSQDCIGQVDHDIHDAGECATRTTNLYGDLTGGIVIAQDTSSRPLTETLLKQLKEYKLALHEKERDLGDNHPDTLHAMKDLALTYYYLSQLRQAKVLQVAVFKKQATILGEDHPDTLQTMSSLASTYHQLGQYEKAAELEISALEKQRRLLGEDHSDTLRTMGNLAGTYMVLGQFTKAEALELEVLEKRRHFLGEDSPDTLHAMYHLATTYHTQGRFEESQALLVSVLDRQRKLLGEDHQDTLWTMSNLASTYHNTGQLHKEEALEVVVLEKRLELLGEDHPNTLQAMGNLAATYHNLGKFLKAEELSATALEKCRKLLGEDHPKTIWIMCNLALTYHKLDKVPEAEELERLVEYHEV